jgi:hypothetical protein
MKPIKTILTLAIIGGLAYAGFKGYKYFALKRKAQQLIG